MKREGYNERRQRGRLDCPAEYHYVTNRHPRYNMPYHWHLEYEIIRILRGGILFSFNEKTFRAAAGDVLFVADGVVHGGAADGDDCVYECLVFELRAANDACRGKIQDILDRKVVIADRFSPKQRQIQQIIDTLFQSAREKPCGYEFTLQGALYQFLGSVFAHRLYAAGGEADAKGNRRHIDQLKRAFQLIETAYAQPLTLQQMADAAGLSAKYFCRFFKEMTQRTPVDYLNYYRIECACDRLVSESKTTLEIAYACGFNDFSYFIKTFRKYKGVTPHKFLAAYKEADSRPNPNS